MPDPIDRFRNVMRNRVETAKRWHGLKKLDNIYDFAMQDPAVAALWAHERIQEASHTGSNEIYPRPC